MSKAKFSVERFSAEDKKDFVALWKGYVPSHATPAILKSNWRAITSKGGGLLAYKLHVAGKAVGFALYNFGHYTKSVKPECYLADLYVDPAYRSQGGGQLLIEKIMTECRQKKLFRLWWLTAKTNIKGQKLYEKISSGIDYKRYIVKLSRR